MGSEEFSPFFFVLRFLASLLPLFFFFAFLRFLRFSLILVEDKTKDCNLLQQKWGISLRPRLHRPRAKLPDEIWQNSLFLRN